MDGWIKMYRKLLDSPVFTSRDAGLIQLWIYILLSVVHKPTTVVVGQQIIELTEGQGIFGLNQTVKDLTGLKQENRKLFKTEKSRYYRRYFLLEKLNCLKLNPTNKYTVVTVQNWKDYQEIETRLKHDKNSAETQLKTYKNVKNVKKERETHIESNSVTSSVDYLKTIPAADFAFLKAGLRVTDDQVRSKAEDLYNWCGAKGRSYKNYRLFLRNALKRDFEGAAKPTTAAAYGYKPFVLDHEKAN